MQHIENIQKLFNKNFVESPLLETFEAGFLHLSSGKIAICDPIITSDKEPFEVPFPKGDFAVHIHKEKDTNAVAYVEIIFSEKEISAWKLATCQGQNTADLADGEIFGFPVESGMACVMDANTQQKLNDWEQKLYEQKGEDFQGIYDEFFHHHFFDEKGQIAQFASLKIHENQPHNLIAFEAGHGEGFYASYIAFDKEKKPTKLVVEFIETLI